MSIWAKIARGLGKGIVYLVRHPEFVQGAVEGAKAIKDAKKDKG